MALFLQLQRWVVKTAALQLDTSDTKTFDSFVMQFEQLLQDKMADRAV